MVKCDFFLTKKNIIFSGHWVGYEISAKSMILVQVSAEISIRSLPLRRKLVISSEIKL